MEQQEVNRKKKSRLKKLICWLLVDLLVAVILLLLFLYKPARYHPVIMALMDPDGQRVHPYMSKELLPRFNNGVQAQRPFRMAVLDKALNEVIAQAQWLQQAGGVSISSPQVLFEPDRIILMGTADVEGADLIVTVELKPQFNEQGLLNLNVEKVKIGAMNITPVAKMMGKKMYADRVAAGGIDTEDLKTQITASLLTGEPFDPIVRLDGKKVRLKSLDIIQGQLDAEFIPAK